jgi:Flp pilus assembly protein protease CpaA
MAFLLGSMLPAVASLVAVLAIWLPEGGVLYCGGSVCLLLGIIVVVAYLLIRKKTPDLDLTATP